MVKKLNDILSVLFLFCMLLLIFPMVLNADGIKAAKIKNVTIEGIINQELSEQPEITINIFSEKFKSMDAGEDVSTWFKNLPTGLKASINSTVLEGDTSVRIKIEGTPKEASEELMIITISKTNLQGDEDIRVLINANARFYILLNPPQKKPKISTSESYVVFGSKEEGYDAQNLSKIIQISNVGDISTGNFQLVMAGSDPDSFEVDKISFEDLAPGKNAIFTIKPKSSLKPGTYDLDIEVKGDKYDENEYLMSADMIVIKKGSPKMPLPIFIPDSTEFDDKIFVKMETKGYDSLIYYSIDGTNPDISSELYTSPLELKETTTVKAMAISISEKMIDSDIKVSTFTKKSKEPKKDPPDKKNPPDKKDPPPKIDPNISLDHTSDDSDSYDSGVPGAISSVERLTPIAQKSEQKKQRMYEETPEIVERINFFQDVKPDGWYRTPISYVLAKGLMNGTSPIWFEPNKPVTRSQLAEILYRFAGRPKVYGTQSFIDVSERDYYNDAVIWANQNKIIMGRSKKCFAPRDNVSREELALLLYRFAKIQNINTESEPNLECFSDHFEINAWALDAIYWAVSKGLIKGVNETSLSPQGHATRAEISQIMMRYEELYFKSKEGDAAKRI